MEEVVKITTVKTVVKKWWWWLALCVLGLVRCLFSVIILKCFPAVFAALKAALLLLL